MLARLPLLTAVPATTVFFVLWRMTLWRSLCKDKFMYDEKERKKIKDFGCRLRLRLFF